MSGETEKPQKTEAPDAKAAAPVLDDAQRLRLAEALIFASPTPLPEALLAARLGQGADVAAVLADLRRHYVGRGVNLVRSGGGWAFRTAEDLAPLLRHEEEVGRKLSRAAIETLSIIAYHQPVTRGEIEQIRGVATSKGTLDILLEQGWIRPGKRRETPGRPLTWITTEGFLDHFGLDSLRDLPGLDDLRAAGLLDSRPALYGVGATKFDAPILPPAQAEDD